ncbi:hypothetical protein BKA63DRAFT_508564 [Paraphoma chrysanthemicola]|nr:hypothetical protein BKA63DRAFT_508564 [Paraphoma chrysanthemicola]
MSTSRGQYTTVQSEIYNDANTTHVMHDDTSDIEDAPSEANNENSISMQHLLKDGKCTTRVQSLDTLPPFDKANGTRNTCIAGLVLSMMVSIACIIIATWAFKGRRAFLLQTGSYTVDRYGQRTFFLGSTEQALVKLAVNVAITLCTDCLGYIHSTSFRWALSRENRLHFNSNLRLLATTRGCSSSRWSMNLVSAFLLMTCYAASGQLFLPNGVTEQASFIVNGIALMMLGIGIMGQALISTLSLYNSSALIPTWSSNPINTVLTMMHLRLLSHRSKRCMMSVFDRTASSLATMPLERQRSIRHSHVQVRIITRLLWSLAGLIFLWAVVVLSVSATRNSGSFSRDIPFYGKSVPDFQLNITAILLVVTFQAGITLGLHIAEMIVNLSRDESAWRRATKTSGQCVSQGALGSIKTALLSWQTLSLFLFKAVSHWLFGISLGMEGKQMVMNWRGLLPLSALMAVLALFTTLLVRHEPKGPQPATYGHLQTLCDLIDTWPEVVEQAFFWGDKVSNAGNEVRHAGTSGAPLAPVQMGQLYAGCRD